MAAASVPSFLILLQNPAPRVLMSVVSTADVAVGQTTPGSGGCEVGVALWITNFNKMMYDLS